jgi:protein tyrosine phosphatase (PTP) superfamily phosphohydrolase (DUF442 family)
MAEREYRNMDAENTYQVFDWLWSSGQLSKADIANLPELGIEAVINLAVPTSSNALPGEDEFVTSLGITYVRIPVVWEKPEFECLRQFISIIRVFEGRKVWVHCAKNMRASAFIYLYRRYCRNEPDEVACQPMAAIWTPNETWQSFIEDASNRLSDSHSCS